MNIPDFFQIAVQIVAIGAFYGAVKVEIEWIKRTLERLEKRIERKFK